MADPLQRLTAALTDRYTVERELGEGGMATVYLAEDLRHDRKVAIKVLKPELASAIGPERFAREIKITAKLQHTNILPLLDSGEADGLLYYVMPLIEGESLRDRLDRETQLPVDDVLAITDQVASALQYAHDHDIVHRDIKPENIMLSGEQVIVADFGIARAISAVGDQKLTETGLAIGTASYMSPEQATGTGEVDGRTDQYALGCMVYEMLAGQPPFTGPNVQSVVSLHLTAEPTSVTHMRPATPPGAAAAVARALSKTPIDRFKTTDEFAKALRAEAPAVVTPTPWKRWATIAATLAVVIVGGILVGRTVRGGSASADPVTVVMATPVIVRGDSTLGPVVQAALERAMLESDHVRLMTLFEMQLVLVTIGRQPGGIDDTTALEIAARAGAGAVIVPSLQQVGESFVVSARIIAPDGVILSVSEEQADNEDGLLAALDALQQDVRGRLGERRRSIQNSNNLLFAFTPSLDAARLYSEANALIYTDPMQAMALADRAMALDSTFAAPLGTQLVPRQILGLDLLVLVERGIRLIERLPSYEQPTWRAFQASFSERDFVRAHELFSGVLQEMVASPVPVDPGLVGGAHNQVGQLLLDLGELERARVAHEEFVAAVASGEAFPVFPWFNSGLTAGQSGESVEAERFLQLSLQNAERFGLPPPFSLAFYWGAAGQWDRAATEATAWVSRFRDPGTISVIWAQVGLVEAVRGRPVSSRAAYATALDLARQLGRPDRTVRVQLEHAEAEFFVLGELAQARAALQPILELTPPDTGIVRRFHARAQAVLKAICVTDTDAPEEGDSSWDCDAPLQTDSLLDNMETLEGLGWEAVRTGLFDDALTIAREPILARAGGPGLRARAPSAVAFETLGLSSSAAAIYGEISRGTFGLTDRAASVFTMKSFALQRLAALGAEGAEEARAELRRMWAEAEPEFVERVVIPLLGND